MEISDKDLTVLEIVAAGGSIMAIGNWRPFVLSLAEKGLLIGHPLVGNRGDSHDRFEYTLSAAGRKVYDGETAGQVIDGTAEPGKE